MCTLLDRICNQEEKWKKKIRKQDLSAAAGNSKKSCTVKLGSEGPEPICPAARTWHFEKGSVRGLVF